MVILLGSLLCCNLLFGAAHGDSFTAEQRMEAKDFISNCFDRIRAHVADQVDEARLFKDWTDEEIELVLADPHQINFRKYNELSEYASQLQKSQEDAVTYAKSTARPELTISTWHEDHEQSAHALCAFMKLTDAYKVYIEDNSNEKAYAILHDQMLEMAGTLIDRSASSHRCFVNGQHAPSGEDDSEVNYEVDRVFFLAAYLIHKELQQKEKS